MRETKADATRKVNNKKTMNGELEKKMGKKKLQLFKQEQNERDRNITETKRSETLRRWQRRRKTDKSEKEIEKDNPMEKNDKQRERKKNFLLFLYK